MFQYGELSISRAYTKVHRDKHVKSISIFIKSSVNKTTLFFRQDVMFNTTNFQNRCGGVKS